MNQLFINELLSKHIAVSNAGENQVESLYYLAKDHGIGISAGEHLANKDVIKVLAQVRGHRVPEPFYRGFPESVKKLPEAVRDLEQLFHYVQTYGLGNFDEAGHSLFEQEIERVAFAEATHLIHFKIVTEDEAWQILQQIVNNYCSSTRPLNVNQLAFLQVWIQERRPFDTIASRDARVKLSIALRQDIDLNIFDIPALAEELEYTARPRYGCGINYLKHLHLTSSERKFVTKMLDAAFAKGANIDVCNIIERRQIWKGLLHHIHYKAKCEYAEYILSFIYNDNTRSYISAMITALNQGNTVRAASFALRKGSNYLLRNLVFILSRTTNDKDVKLAFVYLVDNKWLNLLSITLEKSFEKYNILICWKTLRATPAN